ncbi:unnamed protein product, partial [Ectocarpus sp. 12 AP-2014]
PSGTKNWGLNTGDVVLLYLLRASQHLLRSRVIRLNFLAIVEVTADAPLCIRLWHQISAGGRINNFNTPGRSDYHCSGPRPRGVTPKHALPVESQGFILVARRLESHLHGCWVSSSKCRPTSPYRIQESSRTQAQGNSPTSKTSPATSPTVVG